MNSLSYTKGLSDSSRPSVRRAINLSIELAALALMNGVDYVEEYDFGRTWFGKTTWSAVQFKQARMRLARQFKAHGVKLVMETPEGEPLRIHIGAKSIREVLERLTGKPVAPYLSETGDTRVHHSPLVQRRVPMPSSVKQALEELAGDAMLTPKEVAPLIRWNYQVLCRALKSDKPPFPHIRMGNRSIRILKSEVDAFMAKGKSK
jgi:hypothetical protein